MAGLQNGPLPTKLCLLSDLGTFSPGDKVRFLGWFGGQSAQKRKDTPKNAILGLRSQLEMLQKRERHLQNQMDEQDTIARKNVSTNKNGMSSGV